MPMATAAVPTTPRTDDASVARCNGIEISALDQRQYESVVLENQLQVLLISDPATEKAAAAMDVHVGHQSDPAELPGLAHFLEHMLFLGTEKYPDESSYKAFLSAHSGRSNASTSAMHTNFYFDVMGAHFRDALDHFAQFFVAPLFTPSATDREMNAVDAEHAKNLQNDPRRLYQLQKALANPAHPFHKFGTGNLETLGARPRAVGVDVREALLKFHATYYSASIMKLVLYGKEPLSTLKAWAVALFSGIRNTGRGVPTFGDVLPYDASRLARELHVVPVKDLRSIELAWPLPSLYDAFLTKPSRILSHLIGHEGKGSLLSLLKTQKWANGLSAGLTRDHEDWALFSVKVEATESGMAHVNDVVSTVFQYLHLLHTKTPFESWIFKETQDIALVEFRFKSKETPINYTSYLAGTMQKYPTAHIVSGGRLLYEYDADQVQRILDSLTPRRMRLTVVSKLFEGQTDSVEEWYQTPYMEQAIEDERLTAWEQVPLNPALALPQQNELICTDFEIVTPQEPPKQEYKFTAPSMLIDNSQCRLWFKPDTHFRKPKLAMSFQLFTPFVSATPYHAVLSRLLIRYLKDELTEFSYDAELAGMDYDVSFNSRAIELHVGGFSHKLPVLLLKIVHHLQSMASPTHVYEQAVFDRVKDRIKRLYENFFLEEPYQHAVYASSLLLEPAKWSVDEKAAAVERVGLADMIRHAQQLFSQVFIEAFFYGNMQPTAAHALMDEITRQFFAAEPNSLTLHASQRVKPRVVQLDLQHEYRFQRSEWNADNCNSAICNLYQFGPESDSLCARLELLAHIFKEPCFHQLRTQQQLGYLVFSGLLRIHGIEYFRVLVQSNVASPSVLDQRIEAFIAYFRDYLVEMTTAVWLKHVQAVVQALREKPKRESEESTRVWREISGETYVFDRRERVAAIVETLVRPDLLAFVDAFLVVDGDKRSKLSTRLYGNKDVLPELVSQDVVSSTAAAASHVGVLAAMQLGHATTEAVQIVRNIDVFKQSMPLYPERPRTGLPAALSTAKL